MSDRKTSDSLVFEGLADHRVQTFVVSYGELPDAAHRMDGDFYCDSGYQAKQKLHEAGFDLIPLQELAQVFWPATCGSYSDFKRHYVEKPSCGLPFLSTSDMLQAQFRDLPIVSSQRTPEFLLVEPGTVLVSGSGTIGNAVMATADFANKYVSHDAMRISEFNRNTKGLVYSFFLSTAGNYIVTRTKSGGVVQHIYDHDLNGLLIPLLPLSLRNELTRLVEQSAVQRAKSNEVFDEARELVQRQCYLPDSKDFQQKSLSNAPCPVFCSSSSVFRGSEFGTLRLDASYHDPSAVFLRNVIVSGGRGRPLREIVQDVRRSSLRTRTYVDEADNGVPLVGGRELMQVRHDRPKLLSKAMTRNLDKEVLGKDWTLVTCGGTIGRTMFVHRNYEEWVASEHIMRIVPNESECAPGFIYAFLDSVYGQLQISQRIHGSVIPQVRDFEIGSVMIPVPDDKGRSIHDLVMDGFGLRADALALENNAISLFDQAIERGRELTEAEWGSEY